MDTIQIADCLAPSKTGGPRDFFDCFLADQPSYLVPTRLLPHDFAHPPADLIVNPNAWFSWMESIPGAIAACLPLPAEFLPSAGFIWVCDPATNTQTPFWTGPWFQGRISSLSPGEPLSPDFARQFRSRLYGAGVLVSPRAIKVSAAERDATFRRASRLFREYGYAPLSGLLHPYHIGSLRRYCRHLLRTGGMRLGDSSSPLRFVAHNEGVARFFQRQLTSIVSIVAGVPVKPSYVYVSTYRPGAELPVHTDRAQCEYSITLLLDHTPEPMHQSPWPLCLDTAQGPVEIWQAIGDGLLYRGRTLPHYRTALPAGMTSTSVFFHYVDQDFTGSLE